MGWEWRLFFSYGVSDFSFIEHPDLRQELHDIRMEAKSDAVSQAPISGATNSRADIYLVDPNDDKVGGKWRNGELVTAKVWEKTLLGGGDSDDAVKGVPSIGEEGGRANFLYMQKWKKYSLPTASSWDAAAEKIATAFSTLKESDGLLRDVEPASQQLNFHPVAVDKKVKLINIGDLRVEITIVRVRRPEYRAHKTEQFYTLCLEGKKQPLHNFLKKYINPAKLHNVATTNLLAVNTASCSNSTKQQGFSFVVFPLTLTCAAMLQSSRETTSSSDGRISPSQSSISSLEDYTSPPDQPLSRRGLLMAEKKTPTIIVGGYPTFLAWWYKHRSVEVPLPTLEE